MAAAADGPGGPHNAKAPTGALELHGSTDTPGRCRSVSCYRRLLASLLTFLLGCGGRAIRLLRLLTGQVAPIMLKLPHVSLSCTAVQAYLTQDTMPTFVLHHDSGCECCMSAAATLLVLLSCLGAEQRVTAMQTAVSQQHATDMMGLTDVLPHCHHLGQLSGAMLGSTLVPEVWCVTQRIVLVGACSLVKPSTTQHHEGRAGLQHHAATAIMRGASQQQ